MTNDKDRELIERLALEVAERHRHVTGEIRLSAVQFITACAELIARYLAERGGEAVAYRHTSEIGSCLNTLPIQLDGWVTEPLFLAPQPAIPEGMAWQPIETAPKTGRTILIGYFNSHGNWRTMRGQWFSRDRIDEEWEEPDECEEGWYETSVEVDDIPSCWATNPSHWMPLPKPPIAAAGVKP